jgi:hypothetical protein
MIDVDEIRETLDGLERLGRIRSEDGRVTATTVAYRVAHDREWRDAQRISVSVLDQATWESFPLVKA